MTSVPFRQWRRRTARRAVALLGVGLVLLGVGAVMAGTHWPMEGYLVGALGVACLAVGALSAKLAYAGPYPKSLKDAPSAMDEED